MTSSTMDNMVPCGKPDTGPTGRFAPGQVIAGRFAVIRFIARGGMGEVYEVEDRFLQKVHVALKVIRPEIAGDASSSRRFEQEVLLARKVVHPGLCPIYDIARCDDPPPAFLCLTMKLLAGETLSARLKRTGPIPREEAITIIRQLVSGLAAIHAAGVIHRDIKPNNIMLDSSGPELCVSIMDFGLARQHEAETTIASQSLMAGTPGYMAPEVLRGQGPSQASDLFALGVLLHQVLTGEHPKFKPLSLAVEATPKLDKADVPPVFTHAVTEFLSSDPERRCAAFEHLKAALSIGSSGEHWAADGGSGHFGMRRVSRRQFAVGSAVAASAIAGGVAWKWDRLYDMLHPLPAKRFVALLGWPTPADPRVEPAITVVVNAIGSELARAEAFDHNLFIIPHRVGKDIASLAQVNDLRESLGANLVLSASAVLAGRELELLLRVIDTAASKILRQKSIRVSIDEQLSLPDRAVRGAASLLGIVKLDLADERSKVGTSNPEAYANFQKAEGFRAQENDAGLNAAIGAYKQAVEKDPHYALAKARLAQAFYRLYVLHRSDSGALASADANCQSALTDNPNLVEAHLALASVLNARGDKPGALTEITRAFKIDPHNPDALLRQGQQFTRCDQWPQAEGSFALLQVARPNYWLGYEELGVAYAEDGKYARAVEQFRAASLNAPQQALPLTNLSTVYLQMGELDNALDFAQKSLALAPDDHGAAAMAAALRCKGKFEEALSWALKAKSLGPDYSDNWLQVGDCYSVRGRKAEAKGAFLSLAKLQVKILQTNPADGPAWMYLALAQAKTEEFDKSSDSLTNADRNFTKGLDYQLLKVRTLVLLGKPDEAFTAASACLARGVTPFQFQFLPDIESLRNDLKFKGLLFSYQSSQAKS